AAAHRARAQPRTAATRGGPTNPNAGCQSGAKASGGWQSPPGKEGGHLVAEKKILTKDFGAPGLAHLAGYEQTGGYQAYQKALKELQPDALEEMVKKSGMRGRGGG